MIADLKPYAEYKDSGLPWIGQVPGHWEVKRLKNWVSINKQTLPEDTPGDFAFDYLDIGSVTTGRLAKPPEHLKFANSPSRARRLLQPGDTIVSTVRTYLKAVVTVCPSTRPLVASTGFAVLSPRACTAPHCLGYIAQSQAFTDRLSAESVGIAYPAISETRLGNIAVPLPPPAEQAAIVRFLDWANGRLERAIRAKRKVIALLHEQKQAIIHRAVTRGLDPSVPLKPSGIPWLGEIPAHWDFRSFARLSRVVRGASPRPAGDKRFFWGQHVPWLTVGEVTKDKEIHLIRTATYLTKLGEKHSVRFPSGTLVITNSGATLGVPKILSVDVCANDGIVAFLRLAPIVDSLFAFFYLSTLTERLRDELRQGGTQPNLNIAIIRNIVCPLPPKHEQDAILKFIGLKASRLEWGISRLEREIDLLREYRTRLVADVVTGKLDVREAAARLPEEEPLPDFPAGEEEPLEEDLIEDDVE